MRPASFFPRPFPWLVNSDFTVRSSITEGENAESASKGENPLLTRMLLFALANHDAADKTVRFRLCQVRGDGDDDNDDEALMMGLTLVKMLDCRCVLVFDVAVIPRSLSRL